MGKTRGLIDDISERLCEEFKRGIPLHPEKSRHKAKTGSRDIEATSAAALKDFYQAAHRERLKHGLGMFGKARVAFALQQRLLAAGYPPALVKQVLFATLTTAFIGEKR